jgi:hypothetical protein
MKPITPFRPSQPSAPQRRLQSKHGIPAPVAGVIAELYWGQRRQ